MARRRQGAVLPRSKRYGDGGRHQSNRSSGCRCGTRPLSKRLDHRYRRRSVRGLCRRPALSGDGIGLPPLERDNHRGRQLAECPQEVICSVDLTSRTPVTVRATWSARASSAFDFTEPDNVTTPAVVETSILLATICVSFRSTVFTRAVMLASSMTPPTAGAPLGVARTD